MKKEQKIYVISIIILSGFILSMIYHYVMKFYFGYGYPYNTFLFRSDDKFADFIWPITISANPYHIALSFVQNFPFLYKIASIFTLIPPIVATQVFLLIYLLFFCFYLLLAA